MGWFLITIMLPLIAPLMASAVFKTVPLPIPANFMGPFKDGQLCWVALAFCASALYELAVPGERIPAISETRKNWLSGSIIPVLVLAALTAAAGGIFNTPLPRPGHVAWEKHFQYFLYSVAITLLAACEYMVLHYGLLASR